MATPHNFGSSLRGMEPGEKIKAERERRGWSQADLGRRIGITQVAIKKIEDGDTRQSKFLPRVALELGFSLAELDAGMAAAEASSPQHTLTRPQIYGPNDFRIYTATEGGPGEIIRSSEPIDWQPRPQPLANVKDAYGLYVVGESMSPEYRPGDVALVNPHLPVVGDEVYIFYAEREGEVRATIKHLRRATSDKWLISQHNKPKDFELSRKEWQWAHRVIGKYSRQ
jgi:phage repressor protein C with HTH and peptisase S24 domain/DNA-binding XRE family transcriptional regulator